MSIAVAWVKTQEAFLKVECAAARTRLAEKTLISICFPSEYTAGTVLGFPPAWKTNNSSTRDKLTK